MRYENASMHNVHFNTTNNRSNSFNGISIETSGILRTSKVKYPNKGFVILKSDKY